MLKSIFNKLYCFIIDVCPYQVNRVQLNLKVKQKRSDIIIDVKVVSVNNLEGSSQCFHMMQAKHPQNSPSFTPVLFRNFSNLGLPLLTHRNT